MAAAYLKGKAFDNFELEVKARKTGGDEGFFVMFGMNETQQTLQNAWQSYDKRFAGVDESLGKAVQGIVENVRDNIQ